MYVIKLNIYVYGVGIYWLKSRCCIT